MGGMPVTVAQAAPPLGMSWGEDGIVFGEGPEGIFRVSPKDGALERIVSVGANQLAHGPQILPGGKFVLFTLATGMGAGRWDAAQIVVQSLTTSERKTIINGGSDGRYVSVGPPDLCGVRLPVRRSVRPGNSDGGRCAPCRSSGASVARRLKSQGQLNSLCLKRDRRCTSSDRQTRPRISGRSCCRTAMVCRYR